MPYIPRPTTLQACAHCHALFASRHLRRKYCCNSCNVLASYARTGYRARTSPTKAELAQVLTQVWALVQAPAPALAAPVEAACRARAQALSVRVAALKEEHARQRRGQELAARIQHLKAAQRLAATSAPS